MSRLQRQRGFSLMEMVLSLIILGVIASVGARMLGTGFGSYFTAQNLGPTVTRGQLALERMVREIREANGCVTLSIGTAPPSLQFSNSITGGVAFIQPDAPGNTITMNGNLMLEGVKPGSLSFTGTDVIGLGGETTEHPRQCYVKINFTLVASLPDTADATIPFQTTVFVRNP